MKLTIRHEVATLDLTIPAALFLEARASLRGADEVHVERIGLALLAIGHPVYSAGGLAIYADRLSLAGMAGAALEWMSAVKLGDAPAPLPILLLWARLVAAEVRAPSLPPAAPAEPAQEPAAPSYAPPKLRRKAAPREE